MTRGTSPSVFCGDATNHDALVFGDGGAQTGFFFLDLPTGIYFDSIRLDNPEPFWEDRSPILKTAELLSGGVSVQASSPDFNRPILVGFRCHTEIHAHITALRAKMGAPFTLLIDEYTYENCYISTFKEHEWFMNKFEYEISFVQETA